MMQLNKKNSLIFLSLFLVVAVITALILWLKPKSSIQPPQQEIAAHPATPQNRTASENDLDKLQRTQVTDTPRPLAGFLSDTQIDCHLEVDSQNRFIVDSNTKACFEYFLSQYDEVSLAQIDQQIRHYFKQKLPEPANSQASDLWQRYLKYRDAEGRLNVVGNTSDPDHMQRVLSELNQLRHKFFSPQELAAMFAEETAYNQYTIDKMNIMDDKSLTAQQKARLLKEKLEQLPEDLKKNIADISKLQDLRALTAEIKKNHGSPAQLRQMREQLVGAAAADRLEALDQKREQWQGRIEQYLSQREAILKSSQAQQDQQKAIESLRQKNFDRSEQERVKTFEQLKDKNIDYRNF